MRTIISILQTHNGILAWDSAKHNKLYRQKAPWIALGDDSYLHHSFISLVNAVKINFNHLNNLIISLEHMKTKQKKTWK